MYLYNGIKVCTADELDVKGINPLIVELLQSVDHAISYDRYQGLSTTTEKEAYLKKILMERIKSLSEISRKHSWSQSPDNY